MTMTYPHRLEESGITEVVLKRAEELTAREIAAWTAIQKRHAMFESPYFRPEFTQAVASVREDVEVAVLISDGTAVGFFPFHRKRDGVAEPVGGRLSDFHGVVIDPHRRWSPRELIARCGLRSWRFDHLVADQLPFRRHCFDVSASPFIDLSDGFETYAAQRRKAGSNRIKKVERKRRKLAREIGPVRVNLACTDGEVLRTLLRWKSDQYLRAGLPDLFAVDWSRELLNRILQHGDDGFSGMMAVLHVGDRPAAVDFCLRSSGVCHSWFPAYDPELARYSPGHILLVETLKGAKEKGFQRLHLGKGEESYKSSFANGAVEIADGAVDLRPVASRVHRAWFHTRRLLKQTPLRGALRRPVRWARRKFKRATPSLPSTRQC